MKWTIEVIDNSPLSGDIRNAPIKVCKLEVEGNDLLIEAICKLLKEMYPVDCHVNRWQTEVVSSKYWANWPKLGPGNSA